MSSWWQKTRSTASTLADFSGGMFSLLRHRPLAQKSGTLHLQGLHEPVTVITDSFSVSRGAWGPDGTIVFVPRANSVLHAVSDHGGTPRAVTTMATARGETSHRPVRFLPDGRHFLYAASRRW